MSSTPIYDELAATYLADDLTAEPREPLEPAAPVPTAPPPSVPPPAGATEPPAAGSSRPARAARGSRQPKAPAAQSRHKQPKV